MAAHLVACQRLEPEPPLPATASARAPARASSGAGAASARPRRMQDAATPWSGSAGSMATELAIESAPPQRPQASSTAQPGAPIKPVHDYMPPSPSGQTRPGDKVAPRAGDLVAP